MAAPQWRPNYFCILSFHQIIYSPAGPAEALEQITSLRDVIEHVSPGLIRGFMLEDISPINTKDELPVECKTNISLTHKHKSSVFSQL